MRAVLASSLLLACRVVAGAGWAKPSSISPRLPHALHAFVKPEQGTIDPTLAVKPQEGTPGDIRKRRPPKACCARPRWERGKRHGHASAMVCGATIVRQQCHSTVGTAPHKGPDRTGQSLGAGGWGAEAPPGGSEGVGVCVCAGAPIHPHVSSRLRRRVGGCGFRGDARWRCCC